MDKQNETMAMCMEVAGIESVQGINVGPGMVSAQGMRVAENGGMRDEIRFAGNACEAMGMDTD